MIPKKVENLIDDCLVSFFNDNLNSSVNLRTSDAIQPSLENLLVATIGFSSTQAKGNIIIIAAASHIEASHPMISMGMDVSDVDIKDWAGEMTNQVLGRFKNSLLPYGIKLSMSIPSVIRGSDLRLVHKVEEERLIRLVETPPSISFTNVLSISFANEFDAEIFEKIMNEHCVVKMEGDILMF